jgi:hypothetical protein
MDSLRVDVEEPRWFDPDDGRRANQSRELLLAGAFHEQELRLRRGVVGPGLQVSELRQVRDPAIANAR